MFYSIEYFSKLFRIDNDNPELYRSQYKWMARQTPPLYFIIIGASVAVSYLTWDLAPLSLTVYGPSALIALSVIYFFWFIIIPKNLDAAVYNRAMLIRLHSTVWISIFLGSSYAAWGITLLNVSDGHERGLIALIATISSFSVALCLMHLRIAAVMIASCVTLPITIYFALSGVPGLMVTACLLTITTVVFIRLLNWYSADFAQMIIQQQLMKAKQVEEEKLNAINLALANEDSLTGLANRRSFLFSLEQRVAKLNRGEVDGLTVGILDLDGFKQVNDMYGHPVGDRLLAQVGARLKAQLCNDIVIARLGGDEFGIMVCRQPDENSITKLGTVICDAMKEPFNMDGLVANLGGSVGFAIWQSNDDTADKLFENADYALYHAKKEMRGGVVIFDDEHAATIKAVAGIERHIHDADYEKEMFLVYQPIVSTNQAITVGFEVLARWQSPELGLVSPAVFVRAAERGGTINRLTAALLKMALAEAANWPDDVFMSFNLSMQDITSSQAVLNLISIIHKSGFDPHRITFEITETSMMSNYEKAMESLNLLRNMGAKIAIDDFGTGHSSLAHVRTLPIDKLKLDRSFIVDIEDEEDASAIVDIMLELAQSLHLDCIVEGVETQGQFGILNAFGCDLIQGYYFSKPLTAQKAREYIAAERALETPRLRA